MEQHKEWYPDGQLRTLAVYRNGQPANGWTLRGEGMTVTVLWEFHEGYYFWQCSTPDEQTYWAARSYFEGLEREVRGRR